jgi:hypothetical protein
MPSIKTRSLHICAFPCIVATIELRRLRCVHDYNYLEYLRFQLVCILAWMVLEEAYPLSAAGAK